MLKEKQDFFFHFFFELKDDLESKNWSILIEGVEGSSP